VPQRLPSDLADALRPALPGLAEEIIGAIGREVPEYARPLEGPFGRGLRAGVERALGRFVETLTDPTADEGAAGSRQIYVALGRGEMRAGRSLDALLSAYRLGARIAWERCVEAGQAAGHDPATLYQLATAIFSYIDRISAESVEGYATEQSATLAERQRRRRALVRVLAREDAGAEEVRDLAQLAVWPRPATVAGLVVRADDGDRLASRLGGEAIVVAEQGLALAFVPDPDAPGRHAELTTALDGVAASLGPTVPLERAAGSLARAQAAFGLQESGVLPPSCPLVCDEHLPTLMLHGDGALAADLAARALAPLEEVRDGTRARLTETLAAWLDEPGQVSRVAERLHVHPQTVRYRMAQLRELFGDRLEDPDARFELALAIRVSSAAAPAG
jgi:hypothetical protein